MGETEFQFRGCIYSNTHIYLFTASVVLSWNRILFGWIILTTLKINTTTIAYGARERVSGGSCARRAANHRSAFYGDFGEEYCTKLNVVRAFNKNSPAFAAREACILVVISSFIRIKHPRSYRAGGRSKAAR